MTSKYFSRKWPFGQLKSQIIKITIFHYYIGCSFLLIEKVIMIFYNALMMQIFDHLVKVFKFSPVFVTYILYFLQCKRFVVDFSCTLVDCGMGSLTQLFYDSVLVTEYFSDQLLGWKNQKSWWIKVLYF